MMDIKKEGLENENQYVAYSVSYINSVFMNVYYSIIMARLLHQ